MEFKILDCIVCKSNKKRIIQIIKNNVKNINQNKDNIR